MISETPWLGNRVPNGYWQDSVNRVKYLIWLEKQLGYNSPEDWCQIKEKTSPHQIEAILKLQFSKFTTLT